MDNSLDTATINNAPPEHPGMDFKLLRQEGIRHLQKLSGKIWTDHNIHDPGITILDQLCYALMDLSYRIDYDIKDLLAKKEGNSYDSLFSPSKILTTNPVTLLDLRKVVIDTPGVRNAWVEKASYPDPGVFLHADKTLSLTNPDETGVPLVIRGLYNVTIELHDNEGNDIQPAVKSKLMACRNVCEDFADVKVLNSQSIAVWGSVEIGEVEDINEFAAVLLTELSRFVSPVIHFYSLEEMLAKGKRIDEIVDGPLLEHGFIEDEDLIRHGRKKELHTSDFIREIMDVPGVAGVNNIRLASGGETAEWRLILDPEKTPQIDVIDCLTLDPNNPLTGLKFTKNGLLLKVAENTVKLRVKELLANDREEILPLSERDIIIPPGEYREVGSYHSIQNQFPQNYGIGEIGLPEAASPKRKAQAQQLKAYLLFFDQLLANYFSQVDHLKDVFSFNDRPVTYFNQSVLESVPGANELLDLTGTNPYPNWLNSATENTAAGAERKNRFLNHLMARFNESFTHYSLLVYDYSNKMAASNPAVVPAMLPQDQLLQDKAEFLKHYPSISVGRYRAFDYTKQSRFSNPDNIAGLEKRIAIKLGIPYPANGQLSAGKTEGFYMLEHILFRPVPEDYNAYLDFFISKPITAIASAKNDYVQFFSVNHGLQNGDEIVLNGTKLNNKNLRYDSVDKVKVENVLADSFQVKIAYDPSVKNEDIDSKKINPTWIRYHVNTTFLILTQPIGSFAKSSDAAKTVCKIPAHGLADGEMIEIIGPETADHKPFPYAGLYAIQWKDANTFEIERAFTANEPNGRWISVNQKKDPYSLQLTFVFPDWMPRFKDEAFRAFIENTIREETPVHLTVYVRTLNKAAMVQFESAYAIFLEQLSNN